MCGYIGMFSNDINRVRAYQILQTLSHRGPDEEGVFYDDYAYLGHKRLVVIDKEYGKQPFIFNDLVMIYNGELYNTDELQNDLRNKGYLFSGHSDTEVLIKLYYEYREKCVEKLNGIFSFVIYDTQTKQVFACRDRVGVKPLYYRHQGEELTVSSELKGIIKYHGINEITIEGLQEICGMGPSHSVGNGIYKNVNELRPGHYLIFKDNKCIIERYWNVVSKEHRDDFDTTVDKVRYLVEDSIKRQLISDVPLCTYLSGGLDSTIITLISKMYKEDLETYSIDYEDNQKFFNANNFQVARDEDFVQLIINMYGIKHHSCVISNEELYDTLQDALQLRDHPGMVDIDSSLFWFSKQVKNQFTVALSGECADEIFGGYPWFYRTYREDTFPWMSHLEKRNVLLNDHYQSKLNLNEYVNTRFKETLREVPLNGDETLEDIKHKRLSYINMLYFMTTLLDRKDRMTMGASLEVRVPFADHRIIEYLYNVPWKMKFYQNQEKGLLREAVKDLVPQEVLKRKKNPYPKTHHPEYDMLVRNGLKNSLKDKDSILYELFDQKALNNLLNPNNNSFNDPWFGQLMTKTQLIAYLYQIDCWFKAYNLNIVEK